jgi:hypothetical protein
MAQKKTKRGSIRSEIKRVTSIIGLHSSVSSCQLPKMKLSYFGLAITLFLTSLGCERFGPDEEARSSNATPETVDSIAEPEESEVVAVVSQKSASEEDGATDKEEAEESRSVPVEKEKRESFVSYPVPIEEAAAYFQSNPDALEAEEFAMAIFDEVNSIEDGFTRSPEQIAGKTSEDVENRRGKLLEEAQRSRIRGCPSNR